jgi:hypothetical protein
LSKVKVASRVIAGRFCPSSTSGDEKRYVAAMLKRPEPMGKKRPEDQLWWRATSKAYQIARSVLVYSFGCSTYALFKNDSSDAVLW